MKGGQIVAGQCLEAGLAAFRWQCVRVTFVELGNKRLGGDIARRCLGLFEAEQRALALAFKACGREGRCRQHTCEQIERRVEQCTVGQAAQADAGHVAVIARSEFRAQAFEGRGDGVGIQLAGAVVQQVVGQHGQAVAPLQVARRAGVEHHIERDHWQVASLNEIHACAVLERPVFDLGRGVSNDRGKQQDAGKQQTHDHHAGFCRHDENGAGVLVQNFPSEHDHLRVVPRHVAWPCPAAGRAA